MNLNLKEEEKSALREFRDKLSDVIPTLSAFEAQDANLIRWLRARNLNLVEAESMIRKSLAWRKEKNVDELRNSDYTEFMLSEINFTSCGHDREGALVCILPSGTHNLPPLLQAGLKDEIINHTIQIFEKAAKYMEIYSTAEKIYTQLFVIVDLEGFTLAKAMNKSVLGYLNTAMRIFESNYPERLRCCYIINAPKIFEIFFPIIKSFMNERTLSKVKIFASNSDTWRKALLEEIDPLELTSRYGGCNTTFPWYANYLGYNWPPRSRRFPKEAFKTVTIPPGEKYTEGFNLVVGNEITWNFKSENYDIGFEFLQNGLPMFPYAMAQAHKCIQDGFVRIPSDGLYSMVFDNSYSKFRGKTVHYAVSTKQESLYCV